MAGPGHDAADRRVSHAAKRVRTFIPQACGVLALTLDANDCLGAKRHLSRAVICCSTSDTVCQLKMLLRQRTFHQLMRAQCEYLYSRTGITIIFSSGLPIKVGVSESRVDYRLTIETLEGSDSVTKSSHCKPTSLPPLLPSYTVVTLTQPLDRDSSPATWLSQYPLPINCSPAQPIDCHSRPAN